MSYYGYRYEPNGQYHAPDRIETAQEVWDYIYQNKMLFSAIKITYSSSDDLVAEVKNGHVVYPMYLAILDVQKECLLDVDQFDLQLFQKHMKGSELKLDFIPTSMHDAIALLDNLQIEAQKQHLENRY